jgi:hypothetical protein
MQTNSDALEKFILRRQTGLRKEIKFKYLGSWVSEPETKNSNFKLTVDN